METFTIKQHDTAPPFIADLSDQEGPVNITGATLIRLLAKERQNPGLTIEGEGAVLDGPTGRVQYEWVDGDTDAPGNYDGEVEVTFLDGTVATFPNRGYFKIKIIPDLG